MSSETQDNIEIVDIESLVTDPLNARRHGRKNLDAIKASFKKYGQRAPILVDHNNIVVAGNGRLSVAKELGWKTMKVLRTGLTDIDNRAFAIIDNRTSELADWDDAILSQSLNDLKFENFELNDLGFDNKDQKKLFGGDEEKDAPVIKQEFLIVIVCADESGQAELYDEFRERGLQCKIMS